MVVWQDESLSLETHVSLETDESQAQAQAMPPWSMPPCDESQAQASSHGAHLSGERLAYQVLCGTPITAPLRGSGAHESVRGERAAARRRCPRGESCPRLSRRCPRGEGRRRLSREAASTPARRHAEEARRGGPPRPPRRRSTSMSPRGGSWTKIAVTVIAVTKIHVHEPPWRPPGGLVWPEVPAPAATVKGPSRLIPRTCSGS